MFSGLRSKGLFGLLPNIVDLSGFSGPVYAIGDIHGRLDLLKGLEADILADKQWPENEKLIVYVGDIVDRGPDSFGVLEHILQRPSHGVRRICLQGNHEAMMLAFLVNSAKNASWLECGGHETLISYGINPQEAAEITPQSRRMKFLLERVIPKAHFAFLRGLPHGIILQHFFISHTGGKPDIPYAKQSIRNLIWGVDGFLKGDILAQPERVHGHFQVENATHENGRISIDTGAYISGKLSAARLGPDGSVKLMAFEKQNQAWGI